MQAVGTTKDNGNPNVSSIEWKLKTSGDYTKIYALQKTDAFKTSAPKGVVADSQSEIAALTKNSQVAKKRDVLGSGTAKGDYRIRKGEVVTINGIGKRFNGDYEVLETTHTIKPGSYTVDFKVGANKENVLSSSIKGTDATGVNSITNGIRGGIDPDKNMTGKELQPDGTYKNVVIGGK